MGKSAKAAGAEIRSPLADNYIFKYYDAIKRIKCGENVEGVRAAGQFIHDIFRILTEGINSGEYIFNAKKANKAIRFIENYCHHSEGRADLLKLELWQKAIVSAIFGIMDPDRPDCRMFREVLLIVARKNGKTLLAAAIMAYMAYIDGEYGAKLYCLAPKLDQAELCFDAFYQIVQSDDELNKMTKKRRSDIYIKDFNTSVKKIAFNSKKSDGFNVYFCLNDEIEAWRGDSGLKQYEVISSATGSRAQPLIMSTGTAGYENEGIYDELIRRATAFLKGRSIGKEKERRLLPFLFIIDDVEKWDTREEIEKSNPNLDVSVLWQYYEEQIAIAHSSLSKKAEFLTKFCNIKQIAGNPCHDLPHLRITIIGVGKLLQVMVGIPPHIRLDPCTHDMPCSRHIIGGDTVHDAKQKVQAHHHADRAHGKRCHISDSLICDETHDHRQNQLAQGGQPRTGQIKNHGLPVGLKVWQKPPEEFFRLILSVLHLVCTFILFFR